MAAIAQLRERSLLTSAGLVTLGAFVTAIVVAVSLTWVEFLLLGLGFGLALLAAVPFVIGGGALELQRTVDEPRVEVGSLTSFRLSIANNGRRKAPSRLIRDRIGNQRVELPAPPVPPGQRQTVKQSIDTTRRSVVKLGPATIAKSDPLRLLTRYLGRTEIDTIYIHPRVAHLASMRAGFAKDLDGPTFDSSPAGDVAFHALREYVPGDDIRRIHWLSTAKVGRPMIRHYVDNRRPYLGVLAASDPTKLSEGGFELALEIVASQVVSAQGDQRPIAAWVGSQPITTATAPATGAVALERLCLSQLEPEAPRLDELVERMVTTDGGISSTVLLVGNHRPEDLAAALQRCRGIGPLFIIRCLGPKDPDIEPLALPRVRTYTCRNLESFKRFWDRVVR